MKDLIYFEKTPKGQKQTSIYTSSVLDDYKVWVNDVIDDDLAQEIIVTVSHLNKMDKEKPIKLYINSTGGSVSSGFAIYDFLNLVSNPIYAYGFGTCASMAAFLLICAADKRYVSQNCNIMLHQPLVNGVDGQASDIKIVAENILKVKSKLNQMLADHSKISVEEVTSMSDRDSWLSAEEALEFGFIDGIINKQIFKNDEKEE